MKKDSKTFCFNFDWPKDANDNLKHEIEFIKKINESLAENKIKTEDEQLLSKYKLETIFMNMENNKTNKTHKFVLSLLQRLNLRSSDKHVALQILYICYPWKDIRKQYKNNKLKIIAPTWNGKFELPDGSYSALDIQNYIEYIIKKHVYSCLHQQN